MIGIQLQDFQKILIVLFIGIIVLFIAQNVAAVEIQFIVWSIRISRALLFFIILLIGILIGWVVHSYHQHRKKKKSASE